MKRSINLLLVSVLFCFASCNNDDEMNVVQKFDNSVSFSYKGNTYTSNYRITADNEIIYEDKYVQKIADEIKQLPNLFTYYRLSGLIEYHDSYQDYVKNIPQTRAIGNRYTTWSKLTIYDGRTWSGWSWGFWLDETTHYITIPDLNGYFGGNMNFDNKISSFLIETNYKTFEGIPPVSNHGDKCRVIFFKDKNFGGTSASWEGEPYSPIFKRSFEADFWDDNSWSSLVFTYDWHQ